MGGLARLGSSRSSDRGGREACRMKSLPGAEADRNSSSVSPRSLKVVRHMSWRVGGSEGCVWSAVCHPCWARGPALALNRYPMREAQ